MLIEALTYNLHINRVICILIMGWGEGYEVIDSVAMFVYITRP